MGRDQSAPVGVQHQYAVGPVEHRLAAHAVHGVVLEVQRNEIHPAGTEELVVVVVVVGIGDRIAEVVTAAIVRAVIETVQAEVLRVEKSRRAFVRPGSRTAKRRLIVVARGEAVGDAVGQARGEGIFQ